MRCYGLCAFCGDRFEMTPSEIALIGQPNERKYCRRRCGRKAWEARSTTLRRCGACGAPSPQSSYGLRLCGTCRALAYRSCWRKIRYTTRSEAPAIIDGEPMFVMRCALCPGWHVSRNFEGVSASYERARSMLGLYLRGINFDVIKARGWANELKCPEKAGWS